jgi:hypothetical protein
MRFNYTHSLSGGAINTCWENFDSSGYCKEPWMGRSIHLDRFINPAGCCPYAQVTSPG